MRGGQAAIVGREALLAATRSAPRTRPSRSPRARAQLLRGQPHAVDVPLRAGLERERAAYPAGTWPHGRSATSPVAGDGQLHRRELRDARSSTLAVCPLVAVSGPSSSQLRGLGGVAAEASRGVAVDVACAGGCTGSPRNSRSSSWYSRVDSRSAEGVPRPVAGVAAAAPPRAPRARLRRRGARARGVAGDRRVVVEADHRLEEGVEDVEARGEGVLQVVRPARAGRGWRRRWGAVSGTRRGPRGRTRRSPASPSSCEARPSAWIAVACGHAADPRWPPAAELEVVLPGPKAAAAGRGARPARESSRRSAARRHGSPVAFTQAPCIRLAFLKLTSGWSCKPAAAVVLEHQLAAPEGHVAPVGREGLRGQYSTLRCRMRKSAGIRDATSSRRSAIASSVAMTLPSSRLRVPRRRRWRRARERVEARVAPERPGEIPCGAGAAQRANAPRVARARARPPRRGDPGAGGVRPRLGGRGRRPAPAGTKGSFTRIARAPSTASTVAGLGGRGAPHRDAGDDAREELAGLREHHRRQP